MDPVLIAIIARETLKTALQVRDMFVTLPSAEAEEAFALYLLEIKEAQTRKFEDYDPTLGDKV